MQEVNQPRADLVSTAETRFLIRESGTFIDNYGGVLCRQKNLSRERWGCSQAAGGR
jgi:hypothetical protein